MAEILSQTRDAELQAMLTLLAQHTQVVISLAEARRREPHDTIRLERAKQAITVALRQMRDLLNS